jgi:hypothetical protein
VGHRFLGEQLIEKGFLRERTSLLTSRNPLDLIENLTSGGDTVSMTIKMNRTDKNERRSETMIVFFRGASALTSTQLTFVSRG